MAPRPNWKGYLKLSLVSCPVALYPATTTSERVSFRTLNRETGNRVRRQFVDEQTGEPVQTEDQAKGYEVAKGEYIMLEDDELKAVQVESNHTIDIERFVPSSEIDRALPRYAVLPGAHRPRRRGSLRSDPRGHAHRKGGRAGARRSLPPRARAEARAARQGHRRQPACISPTRCTRRTRISPRSPTLELPKEMLELAKHIIEKMSGKFEPEQFEDRYENALIELIRSKQQGMPIKPQPTHRARPTSST